MDAVKFTDIVKKADAKFTLSFSGREYTLRKLDLLDEDWLIEKFGGSTPLESIGALSVRQLFTVIYHQLVEREDFKALKETRIDDEGFEREIILTGPEMLMAKVENDEIEPIVNALFTVIGFSRPLREKVKDLAEQSAKKKKEKKSVERSAGPRSLTPSQASTDTVSTT